MPYETKTHQMKLRPLHKRINFKTETNLAIKYNVPAGYALVSNEIVEEGDCILLWGLTYQCRPKDYNWNIVVGAVGNNMSSYGNTLFARKIQ